MRMLAFLCLLLPSSMAVGQCTIPLWADEFDATLIDPSKWQFETGTGCPDLCGWGNNELQYYTDNGKNASIKEGILIIEATRESQAGSAFSSSKLISKGLNAWTYGRFEARMRMPLGSGLWPAFWMLPVENDWPMTGEIDIMEYRGDQPKQTNSALHYGSKWPHNQYDASYLSTSTNLSEEFHVYSVEWEANEIRFYFDQTLLKKETRIPNTLNPPSNGNPWPWTTDFYLILNLAVGGNYTGNPTAHEVGLTKPTFEIDYVRVYELPCTLTNLHDNSLRKGGLTLHPMPVEDVLHIENHDGIAYLELKDAQGITVLHIEAPYNSSVPLSKIPKGIYLLVVQTENERVVKKISKK